MTTPRSLLLSVIVPAYNERETILDVLQRILEEPTPKEVIVVDDGSTDGTTDILRRFPAISFVRILHHPRNRGKGAALQTGLGAATGDVWVVQDADLELNPSDYPNLLRPVVAGGAPAVFGSRFKDGRQGTSVPFYLANRMLTSLVNALYGLRLTDVMTGYKLLKRTLLPVSLFTSTGFEIEIEIAVRLAKRGVPIVEVPVGYHPRSYRQGKKIRVRHLLPIVTTLVRHRVTR